jgi:phosphoadenosine phosphosulfate reductase
VKIVLSDDLFGQNKERMALDRLREFEPPEGYYLAYSGGKDSTVILDLARRAGVKFDAHYHSTTVDPPELVRFVRRQEHVSFERSPRGMFGLIVEKGLPTRQFRWCCDVFKERGGRGRRVITGIRAAESQKRKRRRMVEICQRHKSTVFLHPIVDWTTRDVWIYIRGRGLAYCSLYDEGWNRLGCVLCPAAYYKTRLREAERWPRIAHAYRLACRRLWKRWQTEGNKNTRRWSDGDAMFDWWMSDRSYPSIEDDCPLFA